MSDDEKKLEDHITVVGVVEPEEGARPGRSEVDKGLLDKLLATRYEVDALDPERDEKVRAYEEQIANANPDGVFDARWLVDDAEQHEDGRRVVFLKELNLHEPVDGRYILSLLSAMLADLEKPDPEM